MTHLHFCQFSNSSDTHGSYFGIFPNTNEPLAPGHPYDHNINPFKINLDKNLGGNDLLLGGSTTKNLGGNDLLLGGLTIIVNFASKHPEPPNYTCTMVHIDMVRFGFINTKNFFCTSHVG